MSHQVERSELIGRRAAMSPNDFDALALDVFRFQAKYSNVYKEFLQALQLVPDNVQHVSEIPFLPIEVFKHRDVQTGEWEAEAIFYSSGTSSSARSRHLVRSLEAYHQGCLDTFQGRLGPLRDVVILALLPHYLEAGNSSLVSMVSHFMNISAHPLSGFFLHDFDQLRTQMEECMSQKVPFFLFGVSYALHDFAKRDALDIGDHGRIIETGGMKGRQQEMLKFDLHAQLSQAFSTSHIYSEYGMTELLSQAYSLADDWLIPALTMKVLVKELNDPMETVRGARSGVMHIIDLMNIDTCAFIATADLGRRRLNGAFQILGRIDHSDLRGCQLLYI
ncbi:MAG: acyl transferase [Saprospiraceae bacterium]|nr:acyl transferase [Saprospiraceae bacterium]